MPINTSSTSSGEESKTYNAMPIDIPITSSGRQTPPRKPASRSSQKTGLSKLVDVIPPTPTTFPSTERDGFLKYLLETRMDPENHVPCFRRILSCQADDAVPTVFKRLSNEGFTSCPVKRGTEYVGFVDLLDLVKYTTNLFWGATVADWVNFWDKQQEFGSATIEEVMEQPHWNRRPAPPLYQDNSTFHALEVLANSMEHRVPVLDNRADNNLVGILTQSMLISECYQRIHLLGSLKNRKVSDMTDWWGDCLSVNENIHAINAFNMMANQDVMGLAVVNDAGVLVDQISVKDLRGVGSDGKNFARLFTTVRHFKDTIRQDFPIAAPRAHYSRRRTPSSPLYVTPSATFVDVLRLMDDGNIHRIFVCSEESHLAGKPKPRYIITQTDMLRQILWHYTGVRTVA